jgi:type III secretion protein T
MTEEFVIAVYPFLASLPRLVGVFVLIPIFGRRTVRGIVRNEFILVLALFVYPIAVGVDSHQVLTPFAYVLIAIKEALIGVTLGFFLGTAFWVAENVGYLIDLQTGTQNATVFDPVHEHEEGPMAVFMLQLVIALVLSGGGLLAILEIVFESYRVWPIYEATPRWNEAFKNTVSARADSLFAMTLRFAAPMIILLLLIEFGLGLINRFAEQLDVYNLAMPLKSMVALFVLLLTLSFLYDSIQGLLIFDDRVLRILQESLGGR